MGFNFKEAWIDSGYYDFWSKPGDGNHGDPHKPGADPAVRVLDAVGYGIDFEAGNTGDISYIAKELDNLNAAWEAGPNDTPEGRTLEWYCFNDWGASFRPSRVRARFTLMETVGLSWYSIMHEVMDVQGVVELWYNYGPGTTYQGYPKETAGLNLWMSVKDVILKTMDNDRYWT